MEVTRQPDAWEEVEVVASGLRAEVTLADVSYIVADILKGTGANFTLSTCSQSECVGEHELSGRQQLGIQFISPAQATAPEARPASPTVEHSLIARVRRDQVILFPPVTSLLLVRPDASACSQRGVLTWIRFSVDPKDGHTDPDRCRTCGEAGHSASSCSAERNGHRAKYQCFASVPPVAAATQGGSGLQQTKGRQAATGKQQQARQQQAQQQQAGFTVATGSRRAVNQMLNQRPAPITAVGAMPSPAVTANTGIQRTDAADEQQEGEELPTDPAVLAESERIFLLQKLEQDLGRHHDLLAECVDARGMMISPSLFDELQAAHSARLVDLKQASARARKTVAAFAAAPKLVRPNGKAKLGKRAAGNEPSSYDLDLAAYNKQEAQRQTQLTAARCEDARLHALSGQYQAFAARLQQYSSATLRPREQLPPLEVQDTAPQSAADSCESPLSPVILLPPDTQVALAAVTAETSEVGPAATAATAELPRAATSTAPGTEHLHAQVPVTPSAQLELQRNQQLAQRLDEFDAAEQRGTDAEQRRLLLAGSASKSAPTAESTTSAADGDAGTSDTDDDEGSAADGDAGTSDTDADDDDSVASGPSESSESECSDAASSRKARKSTGSEESPQHQQQQHTVPAARILRSTTASLTRAAALSN